MTREEAIAELQRERKALLEEMEHDTEQWCKDYIDALGIALDEMQGLANNSPKVANENDELISRKAAGEIICNWCGVCPKEKRKIMECDDICPQFAKIPAAGEWMSCSKKLPAVEPEKIYVDDESYYQQSRDVLAWVSVDTAEDGIVEKCAVARLCIDNGDGTDAYWMPMGQWENPPEEVIAWMPLPAPYRKE